MYVVHCMHSQDTKLLFEAEENGDNFPSLQKSEENRKQVKRGIEEKAREIFIRYFRGRILELIKVDVLQNTVNPVGKARRSLTVTGTFQHLRIPVFF